MLDFIVSPPGVYSASGKFPVRASIPDEATFAFFARYFGDTQLATQNDNFLGFWGGTDLSGYQLVRVRQVLEDALSDLSSRPKQFKVLRGWTKPQLSEETEMWEVVDRANLIEIAREIIAAIDLARATTDRIYASGD